MVVVVIKYVYGGNDMRMVIVIIGSLALGFWIAANAFVSPETILSLMKH